MQPTPRIPPRPLRPLRSRAKAHAAAILGPLALSLALLSCGPAAQEEAAHAAPQAASSAPAAALAHFSPGDREAAAGRLERLVELFQPSDPLATSDLRDQRFAAQRAFRAERQEERDEALGLLALERFESHPEDPQELRVELLRAAARGLPQAEASALLGRIVLTYDAEVGYGVRGQAVGIWADIAPGDFSEILRPILSERRHRKTLPPDEELLRAWVRAAREVGTPRAEIEELLAEVTVNIYQDDATRHMAIAELGATEGELGSHARRALEEVLVESSRNGYLRRKAAQAIADALPTEDACRILSRVADRESDQNFLIFLADMIDSTCP